MKTRRVRAASEMSASTGGSSERQRHQQRVRHESDEPDQRAGSHPCRRPAKLTAPADRECDDLKDDRHSRR